MFEIRSMKSLAGWVSAALVAGAVFFGPGVAYAHADAKAHAKKWSIEHPPANPTRRDVERMGIDVIKWRNLGRCEQPGNGWGGVNWKHTGPTYLGGLGFYRGTYGHWKPKSYPWPPKATPWQLIIVGERVRQDVGITAWGAHACWTRGGGR